VARAEKITMSEALQEAFEKLRATRQHLETLEKLAREPDKWRKRNGRNEGTRNLDAPLLGDFEASLGDLIHDARVVSPYEAAAHASLAAQAERMLDCLAPREANVPRLRFGPRGEHEHTLEEIGTRYLLTRSRSSASRSVAVVTHDLDQLAVERFPAHLGATVGVHVVANLEAHVRVLERQRERTVSCRGLAHLRPPEPLRRAALFRDPPCHGRALVFPSVTTSCLAGLPT
jgi:hypothetical protein